MDKHKQRKELRARIAGISPAERMRRGHALSEVLSNHPVIAGADYCLAYWELSTELPVSNWLLKCVALQNVGGPKILLPRVSGDDLEICPFSDPEDVQCGAFGIMEPATAAFSQEFLASLKSWVVLVPGIAFDANGNRLGRGKAFYDRFLKEYPEAYTIGLAYAEQEVAAVQTDPWDVPVKEVIFV